LRFYNCCCFDNSDAVVADADASRGSKAVVKYALPSKNDCCRRHIDHSKNNALESIAAMNPRHDEVDLGTVDSFDAVVFVVGGLSSAVTQKWTMTLLTKIS
jgi:hypothetical protein